MNVLSRRGLRALPLAAAAAALVTAAGAAPASADTVSLRIEGDAATLASHGALTVPSTGTFALTDQPCPYDSVGGAIEVGTGGNWDRSNFTSTIAGETHAYAQNDWWQIWQNRKPIEASACQTPLNDGDEILVIAQRDDKDGNPTASPLILTAPTTAQAGKPVEVTVTDLLFSYATGVTPKPAAGVTVTGGGQTTTTNADGKATLTYGDAGTASLQAVGAGKIRSNVVALSVSPANVAPAPAAPAPRDTTAPQAKIETITAKRISAKKAPKLLRGEVADTGGLSVVKLRLTRTSGGRCEAWSAKRERFIRRPKCGAEQGWWWSVGDDAEWEYQLPAKLPKGRYVLDVKATDRSGNTDVERRPGENRVVFEVR
jgi:hypothetical protein